MLLSQMQALNAKHTFQDLVWSEWFWLPRNISWEHLSEFTQGYQLSDMVKHCMFVGCLLAVFRMLLTSILFIPLGLHLGLKIPTKSKLPSIPELEKVYTKNRRPAKNTLETLSKEINMSLYSVEFWFHRRRNVDKKPGILKFSESGWKLCFYSTLFLYGLVVLYDKEYLRDVKLAILQYPYYRISGEIYWYYAAELAYYISEVFWIFYGVRRSDFFVLLVHHMATVGLLSFSYVINHHRIGAVILLLHDIADCFMESAKMFKYVQKHRISEVLFGIFVLVWIVTRLVYFPIWVIYTIVDYYPYPTYPAYAIIVSWLILLQTMHIYWFFLIIKIVVQVKTQGEHAKDCRSDSDTSDDVNYMKKATNGTNSKDHLTHCNGAAQLTADSDTTQVAHRKSNPVHSSS